MLMLRKMAQSVLDKNGLNTLHVGIESGGFKALQLRGECNKVVVTISGIPLKKTTITAKEREYAVELLAAYLAKYTKHIKEYMVQLKKLSVTEIPTPIGRTSDFVFNSYGGTLYTSLKSPIGGRSSIQLDKTGKVVEWNIKAKTPEEAYAMVGNLEERLKNVRPAIAKFVKYSAIVTKVNKLKATLNSCAI